MRTLNLTILIVLLLIVSCVSHGQELKPKEILEEYISATDDRDLNRIKNVVSKKTLGLLEDQAKDEGKTLEELIKTSDPIIRPKNKNPEIRIKKIEKNKAIVEIYNSTTDIWGPMWFVKEDGKWKMGVGDQFEEELKEIEQNSENN